MQEAVVAAVLVAQVIVVHLVQKALSALDIIVSRHILWAGITTSTLTFTSMATKTNSPEHAYDSACG
jgi:hypothetical protein